MTYMDHCFTFNWGHFFQSLINRNVYFYFDRIKGCYVRQIDHVSGVINRELIGHYSFTLNEKTHNFQDSIMMQSTYEYYKYLVFTPDKGQLVGYKIIIEGKNTDACHDIEYIFGT